MKQTVDVRHVTVVLEQREALTDISMTLHDGKITGLLGPSGAGKTTLMRVIVGLQKPKAGTAAIFGLTAGSAALRSKIGYVTQTPSVYGDLSVGENLAYFGAMIGVSSTRVHDVLDMVRLSNYKNQLAGNLSGGQRARVSLAVALLGKPRLLVLDEPTVGLDPLLRQELWGQFHELAQEGVTLLVSSHVMEEATRCDELILMRDGGVLSTGTPAALMATTSTSTIEEAFLRLVGAGS